MEETFASICSATVSAFQTASNTVATYSTQFPDRCGQNLQPQQGSVPRGSLYPSPVLRHWEYVLPPCFYWPAYPLTHRGTWCLTTSASKWDQNNFPSSQVDLTSAPLLPEITSTIFKKQHRRHPSVLQWRTGSTAPNPRMTGSLQHPLMASLFFFFFGDLVFIGSVELCYWVLR